MAAPASLDPRTPVLVGTAERTNRDGPVVDALTLAEEAARAALDDTSAPGGVSKRIDVVAVPNILSPNPGHPATRLGNRLRLVAGSRLTTTVGGNTPQWLVGRLAADIAAGRVEGALIVGAEAGASATRARRAGESVPLPPHFEGAADGTDEVVGDERFGAGPAERGAGVVAPAHLYPLFESALAARAGRTLDEQRQWLGRFMAPCTELAARRADLAWFPTPRSPAELSEPGPDNRLVAEPYTKRLNSIIAVDQAAALVLLSAGAAAAAGVPTDRWVFPWVSADCNDVFHPAARPDLSRSPGIEAAGRAALSSAGIGIDDVAWLDLYSCFPSAIEMAAEALGVAFDDGRGFTVTGGMPYFGGPGNNYTSHAIAAMGQRCREDPAGVGLTTGLGWYVTKHAVGLWSATPPPRGWRRPDTATEQARIDATALPVATGENTVGEGTVAAFTVVHDRDAGPAWVPAVVDSADGRRTIARLDDPSFAASVTGGTLVGARVAVEPSPDGVPGFRVLTGAHPEGRAGAP